MDLENEQEQIRRARTDPEAFGVIFDAYYPPILRYAVRRVGEVAVAEEIVSETFMKALKGLATFRWQGVSIEAWLYKIATNEIRMHFRRHRPVVSLEELYEQSGWEIVDSHDLAGEVQEAQERLDRRLAFVRARAAMATLPSLYQEVLALRFTEQKKVSDIANILGKREGTVKSLLSRGLVLLRAALQSVDTQPNPAKRIVDIEGQT